MKKNSIKKLACALSLIKILSVSTFAIEANADKNSQEYYLIDENGKLIVVDSQDIVKSRGKTEVQDDNISIFDEENTLSEQYGADQTVFEKKFNSLIKDPLIWEELQNIFPVNEFDSYEMALDFYKLYLGKLAKSGCGYMAVTNKIFQSFEGKEEEFERIFGFPMYKIDENNIIDFNYEVLALKFFNYSLLYPNYSVSNKIKIRNAFNKTLAQNEFNRFMNSNNTDNNKYVELYTKLINYKDLPFSFAMKLDNDFGHVREFLNSYGLNSELYLQEISDIIYYPGDIISSEDFDLYKVDSGTKYSERDDVGAHCVYLVTNDNGKLIVSSWGEQFIFDDSNAKWTSKLVLKINK